ncbi:MAG: site-specific integrase [Saprospiraceae bacterium]|nr:site-specific integrase [Saprospiraceae bacterium]
MSQESSSDSIVSVSLKLDTRKAKQDSTFPVKLCIYYKPTRRAKYYSTSFSFSPGEFKSIWETTKPRAIYKSTIEKMQALVKKAEKDLEDLEPFTFEAYEVKLSRKSSDGQNVFWQYDERIRNFRNRNAIGTAIWYQNSRDSIKKYLVHLKDRSVDKLAFDKVNTKWLLQYEIYMLEKGMSRTTISMYLRALRAIFIQAANSGDIDRSLHPFGKGKYEFKGSRKVKKALSIDELKVLLRAEPKTPQQHKAKDFWFFSYLCNGMNIKDILYLRYGQIGKESFTFERIKTRNTDSQPEQIEVFLNEFTRMVLAEYGTIPGTNPKQLVFPFINELESATKQHIKTKAFTRFINQHIKKLALDNGLTRDISTYYARHSFATGLIREGKSIAFVQEALGHSSPKTTQSYMAGFLNEERKETAESLYSNLFS